jgi:hypothetical protein
LQHVAIASLRCSGCRQERTPLHPPLSAVHDAGRREEPASGCTVCCRPHQQRFNPTRPSYCSTQWHCGTMGRTCLLSTSSFHYPLTYTGSRKTCSSSIVWANFLAQVGGLLLYLVARLDINLYIRILGFCFANQFFLHRKSTNPK